MRRIYLDFNATTPVRPEVAEEMMACLVGPAGNPSSLHSFGREARSLREIARERVSSALGTTPESVVFTSGGTEADNLALRGFLRTRPGAHLVTVATEHEAVLHTAESLRDEGARITVLGVDSCGRVDPARLREAITAETVLVSIMAANNETGVLADLDALGAVCREKRVPFHTDAVQCFGKAPFRFDRLPVDLASVSAHKIGGPKGIGALVLREGLSIPPMQTGGGQERRQRPGTENLPGLVGFGRAAELAAAELAAEADRLAGLRDRLEEGLREGFPRVRINGQDAPRLPNTSNASFPGLDGESMLIALDLEGVAVSTGAACQAGAAEPSHVLQAMGLSPEEAGGSLRFSLGNASTESDIREVLEILPRITSRLTGVGPA
jgi:cysteine desulfurase